MEGLGVGLRELGEVILGAEIEARAARLLVPVLAVDHGLGGGLTLVRRLALLDVGVIELAIIGRGCRGVEGLEGLLGSCTTPELRGQRLHGVLAGATLHVHVEVELQVIILAQLR